MSGWNLKSKSITKYSVSEEYLWYLFNFVFSDSSRKRNTYKFGLIKSLLDNMFNGLEKEEGIIYTYEELYKKYW